MKKLALILALLSAPLAAQLGNMTPPPVPKAYIAYSPVTQNVPANRRATLDVHFRVLPGYHVNSHHPTESNLIATDLTLAPAAGVKPAEAVYPQGAPYSFAFDPKTKLSVYAGDFVVKLPVTASPGAHTLNATLRYQACNNASCFPPKTMAVTIPFTAK